MMIPEFVSLKDWAHSLVVDFPKDNVPILMDENNWKNWGNFLIQENSFVLNYAPGTQGYDDWQSWARDLFFTMSNT